MLLLSWFHNLPARDRNDQKNEEVEAGSDEGVGDQINTGAEAGILGLNVQTVIFKMSGATERVTRLLTKISRRSAGTLSLFGMVAGVGEHWNAAFSGEHSPQKVHARASIQLDVNIHEWANRSDSRICTNNIAGTSIVC